MLACLLYRPPNSSVDVLDNLYSALCNLDVSLFSHFMLVGDFNVDFMSPSRPLFSKLQCIASSLYCHRLLLNPPITVTLAFSLLLT